MGHLARRDDLLISLLQVEDHVTPALPRSGIWKPPRQVRPRGAPVPGAVKRDRVLSMLSEARPFWSSTIKPLSAT